jgi:hypothetical protein
MEELMVLKVAEHLPWQEILWLFGRVDPAGSTVDTGGGPVRALLYRLYASSSSLSGELSRPLSFINAFFARLSGEGRDSMRQNPKRRRAKTSRTPFHSSSLLLLFALHLQ